eukprot:CAMPEP_0184484340 /NCGR_PEP_ID=MMETSP0113_2-20130426/6062_1 /TAXON_ID=91329 /ORGANISM="Norrisiella sphaerica, Strain BC52" /LENGTH=529 /DNA_ID=CAMNT_0026865297 /DNA_START=206 /DNA_END=1795 /DNA_ORIENTATION=+
MKNVANRYQKRKLVWIPRGSIFWPAEMKDDPTGKTGTQYTYLGPNHARILVSGRDGAVPFLENIERYSKQSTGKNFVQAVLEAVQLSGEGREVVEHLLPLADLDSKTSEEDTISQHSDSDFRNDSSVEDDQIFRLGSRIRIRGADAIHPKLQAYEKTEAVIVQPPKNPDAWYCVRLNDGNVVKIRRSAFEALERSSPELETEGRVPSLHEGLKQRLTQRPSPYRRNAPRDSKLKRKMMSMDLPLASPKRRKPQGKARSAKSNLVGKYVIIECGRYKGETGYVIRGGNGYYCVQLEGKNSGSPSGNVMKRSSDLRAIPFPTEKNEESPGLKINVRQMHCMEETASPGSCKSESWVNRKVYVKAGKHQGKTGIIRRSGHGFYCVSIKSIGDVMKRASDLELCTDRHEQSKNFDSDSVLKHAARILMEMAVTEESEDDDEPEHDEKLAGHSASTKLNDAPFAFKSKYSEAGLIPDSELKTPILRSTDGDVMNWDYSKRPYDATLAGRIGTVKLPQSTARRDHQLNHSFSNYV